MRRHLWTVGILAILGLMLGIYHNRQLQQGGVDPLTMFVRMLLLPLQSGVHTVSEGLGNYFSTLVSAHQALEQKSTLQEENARLRAQVAQMSELTKELEEMRALLKVRPQLSGEWVGARVIARYPQPNQMTLIIDRGTRDRVLPGMPVVAGKGLVGVVAQADAGSALVRMLSAPRVAVSAKVLNAQKVSYGVCEGKGEPSLLLNLLPLDAPVAEGDQVVSAGLGGKYPPNVPIGVVERVWVDSQYSVKKALVRPYVDLYELDVVLVAIKSTAEQSAPKTGRKRP